MERKEWILPKDLKFKVYMDGDALCIVSEDFKNLQESPAFFVKLALQKRTEFRKFVNGIIEKLERQQAVEEANDQARETHLATERSK